MIVSRPQRSLFPFLSCFLMLSTAVFSSDSPAPQPVSLPPATPTPIDKPYVGTIALQVDLTDNVRGIMSVHETIPVAPGPLTLLYPEWIPGDHSPTGPLGPSATHVVDGSRSKAAYARPCASRPTSRGCCI